MGSEHFKGETISVHVCENVLISTKLNHLKLNSNFWFNLDNFEINKTLVTSLMAIVYDFRGCQLHKGACSRGIKVAHVLLANVFACRTVLTEGASCSKLHKGTVWVSSFFVRFVVFCLFVCL